MKKVFMYFGHMAMCENKEQAIEFINSLPGITCNDHTARLLDDLFLGKKDFHGAEIKSLATTGCGNSRIKIFDALADTIEEHQKKYLEKESRKHRKIESERSAMMRAKSEKLRKKITGLRENRHGLYLVETTIWQYTADPDTGTFPECATETQFTATVQAASMADAYVAAIEEALKEYDIVECVPITDKRFRCEYVGI